MARNREFLFLLWGIGIAFALQVLYDGVGEYPNYTQKFWGGLIIEIVFLVVLGILSFAPVHKRKETKTENKEPEPEKPEETESEKLKREFQYTT